jgi:hypothetical protein
VITDNVTEQSATSIMTAFTACVYSHSRRNPLRSFGRVVQLAVAWLAGNVHVKKIAKKTTKHRATQAKWICCSFEARSA